MKQFTKTKLAAAVGTATMAMALAAPAGAAVVVGGDNGWEISFSGNVNAFYQHINCDTGCSSAGGGEDSSRVTSGFLPAFFTFSAKSPTVNGLTGSARFSFAPTIQTAKQHTDLAGAGPAGIGGSGIEGATIDTREVVADISGSFGTISYGRTLSHFGRQAILKDMTLFGVGGMHGGLSVTDSGVVTTGRVGLGYVYPNFESRLAWTSPNMNGFGLSVGIYDPAEPSLGAAPNQLETDVPRFEGEVMYTTAYTNGAASIWVDGTWQEVEVNAAGISMNGADYDREGWGAGAQASMSGFELTGYYYDGDNLETTLGFLTTPATSLAGVPNTTAPTQFEDSDNDGFYVQGTYTFNGRTKVGVSYGESNEDGDTFYNEVEQDMWTVGVYHDITSWLRVMAEYSEAETEVTTAGVSATTLEYDSFSVGSFILW